MAKHRTEIRNMFISLVPEYGKDKGMLYDIAMLSPGDGYVEYEIGIRYDRMTNVAYDTIMSMLSDYRLTPDSEVCMTDNVGRRNPLSMYVQALAQQIGFAVNRVPVEKITARLCGRIRPLRESAPGPNAAQGLRIDAIWRHLVGSGQCGWITPAYDQYLQTLNPHQRRRKKLVRIGAYYVRRRRLMYQYTKRSKARAAAAFA